MRYLYLVLLVFSNTIIHSQVRTLDFCECLNFDTTTTTTTPTTPPSSQIGVIYSTPASPAIAEVGINTSIPVRLSSQPTSTVTVVVSESDPDFSLSNNTLTFSPSNWNTNQFVTVNKTGTGLGGILDKTVSFSVSGNDTFDPTPDLPIKVYEGGIATARSFYDQYDTRLKGNFSSIPNVNNFKTTVINEIYPNGLPTTTHNGILTNYVNATLVNPSNPSVQKNRLTFNVGTNATSYLYELIPTNPNGKLVLLAMGHNANWSDGQNDILANNLLANGYTILYGYMLNNAENTLSGVSGGGANGHKILGFQNTNSPNHPLSLFLEHWLRGLNYMVQTHSPTEVSMIGYSGGGWTTHMMGAIDDRITKTFAVSGSYPLAIRLNQSQSLGDAEQGGQHPSHPEIPEIVDFYNNVATFEDLYLLSGFQKEAFQYINVNDVCCFLGIEYQLYESNVSETLDNFPNSSFDVISFNQAGFHGYSSSVISSIMSNL